MSKPAQATPGSTGFTGNSSTASSGLWFKVLDQPKRLHRLPAEDAEGGRDDADANRTGISREEITVQMSAGGRPSDWSGGWPDDG